MAETFLVAIPDVVRSSVLVPVAAFYWGYRLRNHRPVQLFPPEQLELSAWDARRDLLGSRHADWTFEPTGYTDLTSVPRLPGEKVRAVAGGGRTHDGGTHGNGPYRRSRNVFSALPIEG
ncbi:MAG: hypothetical protein H0U51_03310 [Propionibacteriales bacterium]|nr:hypothetical protein [Propionibacteriales bacterium]